MAKLASNMLLFRHNRLTNATFTVVSRFSTETTKQNQGRQPPKNPLLAGYRHIYPEFLPDPDPKMRNPIREMLERNDMLSRRSNIDIPEFYVGSILAVTSSDPHSPGKVHKFVGICIDRQGCGLRANIILRNIIDHQGVEIKYELYDPTLMKIQVLRLEKRLDDKLYYLRDALPEYCTFDSNMEPELLPEGSSIPVNPIKVKLRPRPWLERWERQDLKGLQALGLPDFMLKKAKLLEKPWEKYDLMKEYMKTIPEEEQAEIYGGMQTQLQELELTRKKLKRKRSFIKPVKLA